MPGDLGVVIALIGVLSGVGVLAIEIERISEGQRFTTKLLSEKKEVET